jgi:acetyl esterase
MAYGVQSDLRLDPRIRAILARWPQVPESSVTSREEMLAEAVSPAGMAVLRAETEFMDQFNNEEVAPSTGLSITTREIVSSPDGNTIKLQIIRPDSDERLACIYYIHGGGMTSLSCYIGNFVAWGKILAAKGVVVAMVEFRNAVSASSVPEVAPFPAGLNDCVSGLTWVHEHADDLGVDRTKMVISGESGGGNLSIATVLSLKRSGELHLVRGLYALCPFLTGKWPDERYPSSIESNGILIDLHGNRSAIGYGIEAYERGDPLAWPGFATTQDVAGFPRTVVSVNECDPLRDEGVAFYRLLLAAGVPARGRVVLGTMHATELHPTLCPEITQVTASDIVAFATE